MFDAADGLRGDLLTLLGRHDEAVACLEAAAALCERARVVPTRSGLHTSSLGHSRPETAAETATEPTRSPPTRSPRATELGMPNEAKAAQAVLDDRLDQRESCAITGAAIARP